MLPDTKHLTEESLEPCPFLPWDQESWLVFLSPTSTISRFLLPGRDQRRNFSLCLLSLFFLMLLPCVLTLLEPICASIFSKKQCIF
jgi:hypothetical protein